MVGGVAELLAAAGKDCVGLSPAERRTISMHKMRTAGARSFFSLALAVWALCASPCVALQAGGPATAQHAATISVGDVSWLAGRWVGEGLGGKLEEVWSPPAAGQMIGHFSLIGARGPMVHEFMMIDAADGRLRLRIKHFGADLIGWEAKDSWHAFAFVSVGRNELLMDGIEYRLLAPDQLEIRLTLDGRDGSRKTETLILRRMPL